MAEVGCNLNAENKNGSAIEHCQLFSLYIWYLVFNI